MRWKGSFICTKIEISDSDWLVKRFEHWLWRLLHSESGYETENNVTEHTHTYLREGIEGRIDSLIKLRFKRVFGIQGLSDEFKIVGEESIFGGESGTRDAISSEESTKIGLFLIEEYDLSDSTTLNGGIRWDSIDRDYQGTADREDTTFSASGGVSHDLSELWNISGNLNYSERAPDSAELYSDGAHHATESFEIGNPNLDTETAVGFEIIVRKTVGKVTGQFSAFHTKFDNYVFLEERVR